MRPYKVLLFISGVLACLTVLCIVLPGSVALAGTEVRWPTLTEVFENTKTDMINPDDSTFLASLDLEEEPVVEEDKPKTEEEEKPETVEPPKVVVDSTTDTRLFLSRFYASLSETGTRKVRVLHYGDSQIEEDRMTQQIREGLQQLYGGSGVGLMPLVQTIPTNTVRQEIHMNGRVISAQQGPSRYLVYGPKKTQRKDHLYGVMGQVAIMADSLVGGSEDVAAMCKPQVKSAHYDTWRVFADSAIEWTSKGDTVHLSGRGAVYALSQETDTGVIVDNIPMRGCLGMVFTKIDSAQLASFCEDENVRLIIMQFGGNAIPSNEKPETIRGFVKGYKEQIRYLRRCAPEADILFIGPSDMMRMKDGAWQTYPMVAYMDKLLRKMALEENIGYFSLYRWMGSSGSMLKWQNNGWAGKDGIHFTRKGANKAGKAVVDWIIDGLD